MTTPEPCRICGQTTPLTFEHTPPEGAFNDHRARLYRLEEWLRRAEDGSMRGGRVRQRGVGSSALCASCNNNTGSWYVPELIRWAQLGVTALRQLPPSEQEDRDPKPKMVIVRFPKVYPLRFIKQTVAMLLAANRPGRLREELSTAGALTAFVEGWGLYSERPRLEGSRPGQRRY